MAEEQRNQGMQDQNQDMGNQSGTSGSQSGMGSQSSSQRGTESLGGQSQGTSSNTSSSDQLSSGDAGRGGFCSKRWHIWPWRSEQTIPAALVEKVACNTLIFDIMQRH